MGFVNEFISESDLEKHKIMELFKKFPGSNPPIDGTKAHWTVNPSEGAFLLELKSGREEDHKRRYWFMVVHSRIYLVEAISSYRGSTNLKDPNFIWAWNNVSVREFPAGSTGKPPEYILEMVCQALKSYGYRGAYGPKVKTEIGQL